MVHRQERAPGPSFLRCPQVAWSSCRSVETLPTYVQDFKGCLDFPSVGCSRPILVGDSKHAGLVFLHHAEGDFLSHVGGSLFVPSHDWNRRSAIFSTKRGAVAHCDVSPSWGDAQVIEDFRQIPREGLRSPGPHSDIVDVCFNVGGLGVL